MMPALFIGHGSPMNAIEANRFTKQFKNIAKCIPKPLAILSISAHWVTKGFKVGNQPNPKTIHDFMGFPQALFDLNYSAPGSPRFAERTLELLDGMAKPDDSWGFDHGTWCPLHIMYPKADIPVFQLSINSQATPEEFFLLGQRLKPLRDESILVIGSGNIVHNLDLIDLFAEGGFPWAVEFDDKIKDSILQKDYSQILQYTSMGDVAKQAVPTTEHFFPLIPILGMVENYNAVQLFNNECTAGSTSMTSYLFM